MRKKYQKRAVSLKCTQAIIFARVSSKRQKDEGISLEVQEENTTQYCKDNGLKVIARYSIDESSTHGDRAVFHEMINFAAKCEGNVPLSEDTRVLVDVNEPVKEAFDIEAPRIGLKLRVKKASNE